MRYLTNEIEWVKCLVGVGHVAHTYVLRKAYAYREWAVWVVVRNSHMQHNKRKHLQSNPPRDISIGLQPEFTIRKLAEIRTFR